MRSGARAGAGRACAGGRADHQRRDRAGDGGLRARRYRGRGEARRAARGAEDGYARRPGHVDARDHQGHPGVASAGTYILYAAHIAAMAPATNLGAATPVAIGAPGTPGGEDKSDEKGGKSAEGKTGGTAATMTRKQINDASAYIRGLAQMRGRNAEWAERAVREAVSLSATEALKLKVVDLVAEDVPDLLKRLDGRTLKVAEGERVLHTADAVAIALEADWRTRFLSVITDPSIAYVLILLGIYALVFEFSNPGLVFPGVVGAICVLIALYAFHMLPVNYAGLALMLVGLAFMAGELFFPAYG